MQKLLGIFVSLFFLLVSMRAQTAVVQRNVNLRIDPSIDQPPITLLMPPAKLKLLEMMKQAGYLHVRTPDGKEGFVWAKNVTVSDEVAPAIGFIGPAEIYPDLTKTPGVTNPDVTQDNLAGTICNANFDTGTIRPPTSFTDNLKLEQMPGYGDTKPDPDKVCMLHSGNKGCYEEDHLISLENGGHPRDSKNLWPQPFFTRIDGKPAGARQKDVVEGYVRNAICFNVPGYPTGHGVAAHTGMTLKEGQAILTGDWYACYLKIKAGMDCN